MRFRFQPAGKRWLSPREVAKKHFDFCPSVSESIYVTDCVCKFQDCHSFGRAIHIVQDNLHVLHHTGLHHCDCCGHNREPVHRTSKFRRHEPSPLLSCGEEIRLGQDTEM